MWLLTEGSLPVEGVWTPEVTLLRGWPPDKSLVAHSLLEKERRSLQERDICNKCSQKRRLIQLWHKFLSSSK